MNILLNEGERSLAHEYELSVDDYLTNTINTQSIHHIGPMYPAILKRPKY